MSGSYRLVAVDPKRPFTRHQGIVTISFGVSAYNPKAEETPDALIGAADKELYIAKTSGRNMSVIAN